MSTIRFGVNAKKIENKIEANVLSNNEDGELREELLQCQNELRKCKLRLQEVEEQAASQQRRLEEEAALNKLVLQEEIAVLQERLRAQNKKIFEISKSSDKQTQNQINLKQLSEACAHVHGSGLLFLGASQGRVNDLQTEKNISKKLQLTFDCEGKFALEGYKRLKNKCLLQSIAVKQLQRNFQLVREKYHLAVQESFNNAAKVRHFDNLLLVTQEHNGRLQEQVAQLGKKLELFEDFRNGETLSAPELDSFARQLDNLREKVTELKYLRRFEKKLSTLKTGLNLTNCEELTLLPRATAVIAAPTTVIKMGIAPNVSDFSTQSHKKLTENDKHDNPNIQSRVSLQYDGKQEQKKPEIIEEVLEKKLNMLDELFVRNVCQSLVRDSHTAATLNNFQQENDYLQQKVPYSEQSQTQDKIKYFTFTQESQKSPTKESSRFFDNFENRFFFKLADDSKENLRYRFKTEGVAPLNDSQCSENNAQNLAIPVLRTCNDYHNRAIKQNKRSLSATTKCHTGLKANNGYDVQILRRSDVYEAGTILDESQLAYKLVNNAVLREVQPSSSVGATANKYSSTVAFDCLFQEY